MDISVIICTRNRAVQLAETLNSMTKLIMPADIIWELIVVDNGSTDNTPEIIGSFKEALPIKRVFQPLAGLSNARNTGVEAATGTYILFTDDDVAVDENWIAAYSRAFDRWPDAVIFGGKATPVLRPPTPEWFKNSVSQLGILLALRDFGAEPVALCREKNILPFGLNYAIRAAEQKKFLYNPDLGVAPGRRMGGEEIDVYTRLMKAGYTGWWIPDAEVRHIIPPSRQTVDYIRHFYQAIGEYEVYDKSKNGRPLLFFGVPLEIWIKLPVNFVKLRLGQWLDLKSRVGFLASYAYRTGLFKAWRAAQCAAGKN